MDAPIQMLFNFGAETASNFFNLHGYLAPMWIGVNAKGSHVPLLVSDMSDKDKVVEHVRAFIKREKITRYVSMLECWIYEGKEIPPEIARGESLEHNPDRREAIQVIAEDNEGNIISGHFYILRPEHGRPKLSPLKFLPPETETKGRFIGMFH